MPTNEERWKEIMIESGQMPDDNGIWHYNPQAIENPYEWKRTQTCCLKKDGVSYGRVQRKSFKSYT